MFMQKLKAGWHWLVIAVIILLMVVFRLTSYGDPRLSIGTNDTSSYFAQTKVPTFSWEALTVRRLPSYVLLFKMFEPEEGYKLQAVNYPAAPEVGTSRKVLQPGFDNIVVTQMLVAIISWIFFAVMVARHLRNRLLKIVSVAIILAFAFLPPVAEWDSVLMSESGSFSLFVLMLGILLEVVKRVIDEGRKISAGTYAWGGGWLIVFVLWAFMRDSSANLLIVPAGLIIILLAIPASRRRLPVWPLLGMTILLLGLFTIYALAASQSGRWLGSWDDLCNAYITPYKAHLQFFRDHGMPESNIRDWAGKNGAKTYLLMILNFPRFFVNMFLILMQEVFSENLQTYFFTDPSTGYSTMVAFGNMLHPLSSSVFPFGLLAGFAVIGTTIRSWKIEKNIWGWVSIFLILLVYGYYCFTFMGDSAGLIRHLLGAAMPMRLMLWLFPLILADYGLRHADNEQVEHS